MVSVTVSFPVTLRTMADFQNIRPSKYWSFAIADSSSPKAHCTNPIVYCRNDRNAITVFIVVTLWNTVVDVCLSFRWSNHSFSFTQADSAN